MKRGKKRTYGITLQEADKHLQEWMEAELEVTTHQSYQLGSRNLTMADLDAIRREIDYWSGWVEKLKVQATTGGRNRIYRVIPRDY